MKYQEYLFESSDYKKVLSKEETIDLIKKNCDVKNILYRGIKSNIDYMKLHGAKGGKVTKDSSNHYTVILDHLFSTEYKEFPLRSKATVCSSNGSYASNFGNVYVVLPYKNIDVGVLDVADIFDIFVNIGSELNLPINIANELYQNLEVSDSNFKDLIKDLDSCWSDVYKEVYDELDEKLGDDHPISESIKYIVDLIGEDNYKDVVTSVSKFEKYGKYILALMILYSHGGFKDVILEAYDPYELGMISVKSNDLHKELPKNDVECWFSGECILVDDSLWDEIKKEVIG